MAIAISPDMSALPVDVDGGVEASIVARGRAGTHSSLLACVFSHAASVSGQQPPSNVQFPGART